MELIYVTGNDNKFKNASELLRPYGVDLKQEKLELPEIQSDDFEEIAKNKATVAFEQLDKPLFINDAGWMIKALNGFPGPYMKYVNSWFSPQDFINLMTDKEDRTVILKDTIVYIDGDGIQLFTHDNIGSMLSEAKGEKGPASTKVMSFTDYGKSISEVMENGKLYLESERIIWENFGAWLKSKD